MCLRPTLAELETPFSCGWTTRDSDSEGWDTREFASLAEAKKLYEDKASNKELYAYLGEIGIFESTAGHLELEWFTFHTNNPNWLDDSKKCNEAPPDNYRGWGRPLSNEAVGYIQYKSLAEIRNL